MEGSEETDEENDEELSTVNTESEHEDIQLRVNENALENDNDFEESEPVLRRSKRNVRPPVRMDLWNKFGNKDRSHTGCNYVCMHSVIHKYMHSVIQVTTHSLIHALSQLFFIHLQL